MMAVFFNSLARSFLQPIRTSRVYFHTTQAQYLYSSTSLGIDNYILIRKRVKEQFSTVSDKFKTKMNDFVTDTKNMIFTEDLKNMVHIAEPTDLELVLNMVKKFNSQNSEFRFGSYIFGPVVMRMFYFLDAPQEALQCFNDPVNDGFFEQQITYQILLDLLYNHEMYDEMYPVYERLKTKQLNMTKFPKYPLVLIMGACYKQNTPQSMEYAKKIWSELTEVGAVPIRRATTFFAGLALKQGAPHIALESLSSSRLHYVTIRNIRAMALTEMGRLDDALQVLRSVIDFDSPVSRDRHTFFEETIEKVRQAVEKSDNKDLLREFVNIEAALVDRELIDKQTLDQLLTSEITPPRPDQRGAPNNYNYNTRRVPSGVQQRGETY